MSKENDLLRMLEPAVRPGHLPAKSAAKSKVFEDSSFEALLQQVQSQKTDPTAGGDSFHFKNLTATADSNSTDAQPEQGTKTPNPLPMQGVNAIENASLRALLAQQRDASPQPNPSLSLPSSG